MKNIDQYIQNKQTEMFNQFGAIFAFSQKQFDEQKKENVIYVNIGLGLLCPKENAKKCIESINEISKEKVSLDLKYNSKESIIKRELYNREAFYTGELDDTIEALCEYPFTKEEIYKVFKEEYKNADVW